VGKSEGDWEGEGSDDKEAAGSSTEEPEGFGGTGQQTGGSTLKKKKTLAFGPPVNRNPKKKTIGGTKEITLQYSFS
jgi:hypothetical protein